MLLIGSIAIIIGSYYTGYRMATIKHRDQCIRIGLAYIDNANRYRYKPKHDILSEYP